jgi:hypothetical protein
MGKVLPARSATAGSVAIQLARARVSVLAAHAHAARLLAVRLADRIPTDAALALYCDQQQLRRADAEFVAMQALARMTPPDMEPRRPLEALPGRQPPGDAWFARGYEWVRDRIAPLSDPVLHERVETEVARARAVIMAVHIRHAARLVDILAAEMSAPAAIALYIQRMDVEPELRAAVYAIAVARQAGHAGLLAERADMLPLPGDSLDGTEVALDAAP